MELTKPALNAPASPFNALITMFYEPGKTFAALEPRKASWLPLVLVVLAAIITNTWYFSMVDFAWFQDQMLSTMPATEADAAKSFMTRGIFLFGGLIGTMVAIPAVVAITGVYFMLVSKAIKHPVDFNTGFSLGAWSCLPIVLTLPLAAMQILLSSNGQLTFSELNPFTLNQLVYQVGMGHPMAGVTDAISVFTIWNIFLLVVGFEVWAKVKRSMAILTVVVPHAVIYGVWFAYATAASKAL